MYNSVKFLPGRQDNVGDKPEGPAEKPSFLSTTTGMLTALATTIASVTALVTALYTAGVIGHKSPDNPAPTPVVQHDNSGQTPAPNAGGRVAPAVNTGGQPGTDSQTANWRAAVDSIDPGQYSLQSYQLNGRVVPVQGVLMLKKQPDGDLQFHSQLHINNVNYWYQGMVRYRNGAWHQQILGSNDPTTNKIPVVINLVERNGQLAVQSATTGVQMSWIKQ
jgi:hypothetical protein